MKRTEVSWEVHSLYVFRSQQDKKNFRSATLVLLYRSNLATSFPGFSSTRPLSLRRARRREPWERDCKLSISRQNSYAKQNIILLHFLANKPRRELSGIRKKEKPFTPRVLSVRMQNWVQQLRRNIAGNHHIHSKYVIQTKLLPWATLIQLLDVRLNCLEV